MNNNNVNLRENVFGEILSILQKEELEEAKEESKEVEEAFLI
jgi:hypothetical protein